MLNRFIADVLARMLKDKAAFTGFVAPLLAGIRLATEVDKESFKSCCNESIYFGKFVVLL